VEFAIWKIRLRDFTTKGIARLSARQTIFDKLTAGSARVPERTLQKDLCGSWDFALQGKFRVRAALGIADVVPTFPPSLSIDGPEGIQFADPAAGTVL
jgi:hypothetical protein